MDEGTTDHCLYIHVIPCNNYIYNSKVLNCQSVTYYDRSGSGVRVRWQLY